MKALLRVCTAACLGGPLLAQGVALPQMTQARTMQDIAVVGEAPYATEHVIVRFSQRHSLNRSMASVMNDRYVVDKQLIGICDMYRVLILDGTPVVDAVRELRAMSTILYASADHLTTTRVTTPDDTSFGSQWNMNNTGQSGGTADADIDATEAWDLGVGSHDFAVAVVDNGFDIGHADLVSNLYVNTAESAGTPGVDDDANGYVDDINGWSAYTNTGTLTSASHGTHVSGITGAAGNNTLGVTGVNWDVTIVAVQGSTSVTSTALVAYGYVCDQKNLWLQSGGTSGVNIVATNNSFGIDFADCTGGTFPQWNDAYDAMGAMGILSAAATINSNQDIDVIGDVPTGCSSDWIVSVTNTNDDDEKNGGAGFGLTTIDLGAPGTSVFSTLPGGYGTLSGTSMATPHVAGAVAFLHSVASADFATVRDANPAAAALILKEIMLANVDVIPDLTGATVSDGRLNLNNAALAISGWGSTASVVQYGLGAGGANVGTLDTTSPALEGITMEFDVSGIPNGTFGSLRFGLNQVSFGIFGGTLLAASTVATAPFALIGGNATISVPMPVGLAGLQYYVQAAALDATQSAGIAFTNGLDVTMGK